MLRRLDADTKAHAAMAALGCAAVFALFWLKVFADNGGVPGNYGDNRFNLYLLEHVSRWMTGRQADVASPPFYFPYPQTLFWSDTHFATAPVYGAFRLFGLSEFTAFSVWVYAGYASTYLAAHYALARCGFSPVVAGSCAFVFACGLPNLAQIGHAQLAWRTGVPLATYFAYKALRDRSLANFLTAVIWACLQLLANIYTGMFLIIFLGLFGLCYAAFARDALDVNAYVTNARVAWGEARSRRHLLATALGAAALSVIVVVVLGAYAATAHLYAIVRNPDEIKAMLPRWGSYLIADIVPFWANLHLYKGDIPLRHEHNLFIGGGAAMLVLAGVITILLRKSSEAVRPFLAAMLASAVAMVALTTMVADHSAFMILAHAPGFNALRAVTRSFLITLLPLSFVAAAGVQYGLLRLRPQLAGIAIACLCAAITLYEFMEVKIDHFSAIQDEQRLRTFEAQARAAASGVNAPILFITQAPGQPNGQTHIDAMLVAQRLNWPTVNGYSGFLPAGAWDPVDCATPLQHALSYEAWRTGHPKAPALMDFAGRVVSIGPRRCPRQQDGASVSSGPPPPATIAPQISLHAVSLEQRGTELFATIRIKNASDMTIHAVTPEAPVRLSWKFIRLGAAQSVRDGWSERAALLADVPAHGAADAVINAQVPIEPGIYRMQVSMVTELRYWFHEAGMTVLTIEQRIEVAP